jgi:hypothetical protein
LALKELILKLQQMAGEAARCKNRWQKMMCY